MKFLLRAFRALKYWAPGLLSIIIGPATVGRAWFEIKSMSDKTPEIIASNAAKDLSTITARTLDSVAIDIAQRSGTVLLELENKKSVSVLGEKLLSLVSGFATKPGEEDFNFEGLRVVLGNKSMSALIGKGDPVANVRQGVDQGMVDLFNVDNFFPEARILRDELFELGIQGFVNQLAGRDLTFKSMNAYVNLGVGETRGFHVDAYGVSQFKVFVYLTDVFELENGPYCYVLESHSNRRLELANRYLAKKLIHEGADSTDVLLYDASKAIPLLAGRGSLIISDQSGAHRGYPQGPQGKRAICVLNFIA